MSETYSSADQNDGIEPDMIDQNDAPVSVASEAGSPEAGVVSMNMIQALNSALNTKMEEDPNVLSFGEDTGYFGGVFRVTDQLQQ